MTKETTMSSVRYQHWRSALEGRVGEITETEIGLGFFRKRPTRNAPWIFVALWEEDGLDWVQVGNEEPTGAEDTVRETWLHCAKYAISEKEYRQVAATGRWLTDPPEDVTPADTLGEIEAVKPPPVVGPGHNSGDVAAFAEMRAAAMANVARAGELLAESPAFQALRAELLGDIAEAQAFYAKNALKDKADADKCENWRDRIAKAAKAADDARAAEKALFKRIGEEIDARYFPVIRAAEAQAKTLRGLGDGWVRTEQERLRRIAEEEARARFEEERKAAQAERERLAAERAQQKIDDPVAALTSPEPELPEIPEPPAPVIAPPKVLIGTGPTRRSARAEPPKATIIDLAQAAAYYAHQQHPDLVALIQKLADRACKAKANVPGVRMSWDQTKQGAAA